MTQKSRQRLILALDGNDKGHLEGLVHSLKGLVCFYKVGCWGYTAWGPEFVSFIRRQGGEVFLDLKYHDIPHSVAGAVVEAARLGVYFLSLHAVGGVKMMSESVQRVSSFCRREGLRKPKLLAITILTSLDQLALREELGVNLPLPKQVLKLAKMAQEAGMDGVVASPHEVAALRRHCSKNFLLVTPGVRPARLAVDDQQRVLTPQQALRQGADYLVIGRPITQAPHPRQAVEEILQQMDSALK